MRPACSNSASRRRTSSLDRSEGRPFPPRRQLPTLIIQGDSDISTPLEICARRVSELLPNSRLVLYENGPHGLYLTHRDRLNDDLHGFIVSEQREAAA